MSGGGSERQLLNLARYLDRDRFSLSLYLLYAEGALLPEIPSDISVTSFWGSHMRPRWNWPGRIHGWQKKDLHRYLLEHRIDVTYDRLFHMAMLTGPAAEGTSVARVSTIVSPPSRDLPHSDRRLLWIKKRVLRRSYQSADQVLAVSQSTADDAECFYHLLKGHVQVLPSPTDIDRIDRSIPLDPPKWNPHHAHLLCVGRLSDEKGQEDLIAAFAMAQSRLSQTIPSPQTIELHLLGEGPNESLLRELVRQHRMEQVVHFHGHVTNPYSMMAACDLVCIPSHYEGFPNVMMEAMVCRVPIVATAASASMEQLMSQTYGLPLSPPRSIEGLAQQIVDRFEHPDRWNSGIEVARRHVEKHHSMGAWIEQMSRILESAVHHRRRISVSK